MQQSKAANTVPTQRTAAVKPANWNPGPRGLDPPLQVNQTILDTIKKRKDKDKLCNNHYLRGPCSKGDNCCFEHKYRPSPEEKICIAFLARLNPCTNGQDCEVENCIYGHHVSLVTGLGETHDDVGMSDHVEGKMLTEISHSALAYATANAHTRFASFDLRSIHPIRPLEIRMKADNISALLHGPRTQSSTFPTPS